MMTEEEKRIYTIDDIARELGVSKTTVSRAISGSHSKIWHCAKHEPCGRKMP